MRVTHVITRLIVGGAQENTIATVLGLRERHGVAVQLISGPTTGPEGSLEDKVTVVPDLLTLVPELIRPIHPWKDTLAFLKLAKLFREHRPQIVHTHSGKAGVLGRLAASRARVPVIVHSIHGPSFGNFQSELPNAIFRIAERIAGRCTTHFIAVANAMIEQYRAVGIGQIESFSRIFSGFDLEPFLNAANDPALRARYAIRDTDIVVGKIARLFKLKGHDDLLTVAPKLVRACPQMKFLLVGDGAWRCRLEARARDLGLGNHFIFTGLVPPDVVPRLIGMMDIVVHLSRREGLARALPQALAAARPVVAYDCDGASEVCVDDETGFLVKPGDLAALTQCLNRLAASKNLRESLGRRGQAFVAQHFSVEKMVDAQHALYLKLLDR